MTKSKYINAAAHGGELVGGTEELGELRQRVHIDRAAERTVDVLGEPTAVLRRSGHQGQALSFDELSKRVGKDLHELGCDQTPCLVGLPVYAPAFRKATTCTT